MRGNAFRPLGDDGVAVLAHEDGRHESSLFADDVVVDFPSISRAVDRMRRAFLIEERPHAMSTHIQITAREAREGATVPLDVPVRRTCRQCDGRGESWTESCVRCHGSGTELTRHPLQVTVPAGVPDGALFQFTLVPRHNPPTRIELRVSVD